MTAAERYESAAHRMQSATALDVTRELGVGPGSKFGHMVVEKWNRFLKHLRVGNNARAVDQLALVELLIARGVFTADEYVEAVAVSMEKEADERCDEVRKKYNLPDAVRFG